MLIGLDAPDDAAVYAWDEERAIVSSLDFFTPIVDDAYTFGAIAAANALSDVYAMGGVPLFALNIVAFPTELDKRVLIDILRGGRDKALEAGVPVIGGHSIDDKEPKYGMVVIGRVSTRGIYRKGDGRAGDRLVLTKAIGTGIISTAIKHGAAPEAVIDGAVASMLKLNARALDAARGCDVGALTDVTGYGLLGHLVELARASRLAAAIDVRRVPLLPQVRELAVAGHVPGGTLRNREWVRPSIRSTSGFDETDELVLCDAQTSGGLLITVAPADAARLVDELRSSDHAAAEIGELVDDVEGVIELR